MIKTGEQHIASLRDGREIYLDGELVDDVTTHPAFRGAVASIGRMFDFQSAPENRDLMTFETETGTRANRIWQLPGSYDALVKRRRASKPGPSCMPASWAARRITSPRASPACIWGSTCSRPTTRNAPRRWRTTTAMPATTIFISLTSSSIRRPTARRAPPSRPIRS